MAQVVVFHHVHGLTRGVREFAEGLQRAGHTVHVPDLFAGRVFADFLAGVAHAEEIGLPAIVERGRRAVGGLPAGCVYAGFSLGVLPAQALAQTRAGARGALLYSGCLPVTSFADRWPAGVPVQVHGMVDDAIFAGEGDLDSARALLAVAHDAELYLYAGKSHLFADASLPAYDAAAARMLTARTLSFLDRVGQ